MHILRDLKNKEKLMELVENDKEFSDMNRRTAILLNECTHSGLKFRNSKGRVDMCQAIKDIREEGRQEGREEGRIQAMIEMGMEFGMPDVEILKMLQEKMKISSLKAQAYLGRFGKTRNTVI